MPRCYIHPKELASDDKARVEKLVKEEEYMRKFLISMNEVVVKKYVSRKGEGWRETAAGERNDNVINHLHLDVGGK